VNPIVRAAAFSAVVSFALTAPSMAAVNPKFGLAPARTAAATGNIIVTSNVTASCAVADTTLAFGTYDPLVANLTAPLTTTTNVAVTCTQGSAPIVSIAARNGNTATVGGSDQQSQLAVRPVSRIATIGGNPLNYTFNVAANSNANAGGTSNPFQFPVNGSIPPAQDVSNGNYSDSLVATVSF